MAGYQGCADSEWGVDVPGLDLSSGVYHIVKRCKVCQWKFWGDQNGGVCPVCSSDQGDELGEVYLP